MSSADRINSAREAILAHVAELDRALAEQIANLKPGILGLLGIQQMMNQRGNLLTIADRVGNLQNKSVERLLADWSRRL